MAKQRADKMANWKAESSDSRWASMMAGRKVDLLVLSLVAKSAECWDTQTAVPRVCYWAVKKVHRWAAKLANG